MVKGKTFENLHVWQEAQNLAVMTYKKSKDFSDHEIFGLTNQLRRAVVSVSANISEGYGRSTDKDNLHFCSIAYGSLLEVKNFFYLALRLGYLTDDEATALLQQTESCQKLLNGYTRSIRNGSTN